MRLFFLLFILVGVIGTWVDPDTPSDAHQTLSLVDNQSFDLVFSDEFNITGRTFDDGHDNRWTALHKNDYTNTALQFYDKRKVTTSNGYLNISTMSEKTIFMTQDDKTLKYRPTLKNFTSGMVQSWNKFCFTGGIIEIRAKLPGSAEIGGLWPAMWLMGNLARATYVASSDWIWPWSFDTCNRDLQPKQLISACNPNPHYNMDGMSGRGAPEIDILEAMPGIGTMPPSNIKKPYFSASLQIAPGVAEHRPGNGGFPRPNTWYEGMEYGENTSQNIFFYGTLNTKKNPKYSYQSDAISSNTQLFKSKWENEFHVFRVEWALPHELEQGYLRWYMNDELVFGIRGNSLKDITGAMIPTEPSYILLNTAVSSSWGFPDPCPIGCKCKCFDCEDLGECGCGIAPGFCDTLPSHFLIDYVRVFQLEADEQQKVGCSTPERPTKKWIQGHATAYKDIWDQQPLLAIQRGGGDCSKSSDCMSGKCVRDHCLCNPLYTGPNCLSHDAFDPIIWEIDPGLSFYAPLNLLYLLLGSMVALMLGLTWIQVKNQRRGVFTDSSRIHLNQLHSESPREEIPSNGLSYETDTWTEVLRDIPVNE